MFPKNIYMCHKELTFIRIYSQFWKKLNPEYEIHLYDNLLCEQFLFKEFGKMHQDIFRFIPDGPIKADFWRICVLFKYGGVYVDSDIEPIVPLCEFIDENVELATCISYYDEYNPHFIVCNAGNELLKKAIYVYLDLYASRSVYDYWKWSICKIFSIPELNDKKEDGIYMVGDKKYILLKEKHGTGYYDNHCVTRGIRVFNNRYGTYNSESHCFFTENPYYWKEKSCENV